MTEPTKGRPFWKAPARFPGGKGTANMVAQARAASVRVFIWS
jgi:hypothetical protein